MFCTGSVAKKPFGLREILLIGSCVAFTGYIVYTLYTDNAPSAQQQQMFANYVLNKLFENERSTQYFFGDTSDLTDEKKKENELITSHSKATLEYNTDNGKVWTLEQDVESNTGACGRIISTFRALDKKTFKMLLNRFGLNEKEKEQYEVLGRVVSIVLDLDYEKTVKEDGTVVENYTEWKVLDEQVVLFDIKNMQWEDVI